MSAKSQAKLLIREGTLQFNLAIDDIVYLQADHVYVRIYLRNEQCILIRNSLTWLIGRLPADRFVQVHRSYAVNLTLVTRWSRQSVFLHTREIPVSRSRQKEVNELLYAYRD